MAFSDARNEAARAATGHNATNHGNLNGNQSAAAARGISHSPLNPRARMARNVPSPGISAPATMHNLGVAGMMATGLSNPIGIAGRVAGFGPQMEGPFGASSNFSYDGPDRTHVPGDMSGMGGQDDPLAALRAQIMQTAIGQNPQWAQVFQAQGMMNPAAQPTGMMNQPQLPPNGLGQQTVPGKQLSVGGGPLPAYGASVPSYGYFR